MSTVSIDSALLREADGILTDMMADPTLPRHLLSGLRAVSNMIKPIESHAHGGHRSKISPLVSLSEAALSGPEYAEWPHSDRLSYLPKVCFLIFKVIPLFPCIPIPIFRPLIQINLIQDSLVSFLCSLIETSTALTIGADCMTIGSR